MEQVLMEEGSDAQWKKVLMRQWKQALMLNGRRI